MKISRKLLGKIVIDKQLYLNGDGHVLLRKNVVNFMFHIILIIISTLNE